MAHYAKYKDGDVVRLLHHDDRKNTALKEHIDPERSHLNYNLAPHERETAFYNARKNEAIETGSRFNSRTVGLVSCVITLPKDFPFKDDPKKVREFFEECVRFLNGIHGEENLVSAWCHFDEVQPHLHYKTTPLLWQTNKEGKEVLQFNAKKILTPIYLRGFHENLQKHLTLHFGEPIHILNGETENGNLSTEQLKQNTRALETEINHLNENFEAEKDNIKRTLESIETAVSRSVCVEPIKEKKDKVVLSRDDYERLSRNTYTPRERETLISLVQHLKDTLQEFSFASAYRRLFKENQKLKKQLEEMKRKFHSLVRLRVRQELENTIPDILQENDDLKKENEHLRRQLEERSSKNKNIDFER